MGLFRRKKGGAEKAPTTESPAALPVLEVANIQGQGDRAEQQDAFGLSLLSEYEEKGLLAFLCDGMGGMEAGREIARDCVQKILSGFPLPADTSSLAAFDEELLRINREIFLEHAGRGGSTLVLVFLIGNALHFRCIGDSDLFLLRDGEIVSLNEHQTYGNELLRRAISEGTDTRGALGDPQADALIRFLGCAELKIEQSFQPLPLLPGDTLLLCSDGVSGTVLQQDLLAALAGDVQAGAEQIEEMILAAAKPNQDNYTAIIIRYNGESDKNK